MYKIENLMEIIQQKLQKNVLNTFRKVALEINYN